jgi:hypothetical protein
MLYSLTVMLLTWLCASSGDARGECPDQVLDPRKMQVDYGPNLGCGGARAQVGGISLSTTADNCPAFITITPAHNGTRHQPGSNTYTRPDTYVKIVTYNYSCEINWILFIPFGSRCVFVDYKIVGTLRNYVQLACPPARADS